MRLFFKESRKRLAVRWRKKSCPEKFIM